MNKSQEVPALIRLCCCCHPKDELYLDELEDHFAALTRQGRLIIWTHHKILPGISPEKEIHNQLTSSDIVLLLASRYFFSSDPHWKIMEHALELHEAGIIHVVPVSARPYDYEATPLGELQIFPRKRPLSRFTNRDDGYVEVVEGVRGIIQNSLSINKNDKRTNAAEKRYEVQNLNAVFPSFSPTPSILVEKGDILFKHQHYDEALAAYEDALRLDPNCIAAHQGRAQVWNILASLTYDKIRQLTIKPFERVQLPSDTQEDGE